jgi:hypothetical protein
METQWCPTSKEVQDRNRQADAGICILEQRWMLINCLEKGATIAAKHCVVLLDKLKQQLVSKHQGKLL